MISAAPAWRTPRTWIRCGYMAMAVVMLAGAVTGAVAQTQPDEYQLQAAFLFNFGKFIDWPPTAKAGALIICLTESPKTADALEALTRGKRVNGREVTVQRGIPKDGTDGCHILFIGQKTKGNRRSQLAAIRNLPVLTVGADDDFLMQGGMVNLANEDSHIQLQINRDLAERAGLTLSSKLLSLAKIVRSKS